MAEPEPEPAATAGLTDLLDWFRGAEGCKLGNLEVAQYEYEGRGLRARPQRQPHQRLAAVVEGLGAVGVEVGEGDKGVRELGEALFCSFISASATAAFIIISIGVIWRRWRRWFPANLTILLS